MATRRQSGRPTQKSSRSKRKIRFRLSRSRTAFQHQWATPWSSSSSPIPSLYANVSSFYQNKPRTRMPKRLKTSRPLTTSCMSSSALLLAFWAKLATSSQPSPKQCPWTATTSTSSGLISRRSWSATKTITKTRTRSSSSNRNPLFYVPVASSSSKNYLTSF